ncbi:MAG: DUF1343 domain-containing protein [Spirochaetia bacterium]|nr:DUF1343 domain-containing protein [Spirochaetia bacterium]
MLIFPLNKIFKFSIVSLAFLLLNGNLLSSEKIIFISRTNETKFYHTLFNNIREKNFCLISNQAGTGKYLFMPSYKKKLSYLHEMAANHNLLIYRILTPEHGLSGQSESTGIDTDLMLTGNIPIFPVYHKTIGELAVLFDGCMSILFDLPDAGIRPFTYRTILTRTIQALGAMGKKIPLYLIDQPNPASIYDAMGPMVQESYFSYLGEEAIPFFPGYSYAELARYYISRHHLSMDIRYIAMPHYTPGAHVLDYPMDPPSPSLPHKRALHCYWIGIFLEGTSIDYGKYSKDPFCLIGHPDIDFSIQPPRISGIKWVNYVYKPFGGIYKDRLIRGYRMEIDDIKLVDPVKSSYKILEYFHKNYPDIKIFTYNPPVFIFDKITGSSSMRTFLEKGLSYEKWFKIENSTITKFNRNMYNFRLY